MVETRAEWKAQEVKALSKLINEYKTIAVASLHKVRASQLQALSKKLRGSIYLHVSKNTLMQRALEKCAKQKANLKKLSEHITGPNVFIFTDMDPFQLTLALRKGKVKIAAKAGDIAPIDIVVPAGNTGLPPGPIMAELAEVGVPTRIETGSVVITKDTVVAGKGEMISPKLASILSKIGIKPIEVGLSLNVAYADGTLIPSNLLEIDLETVKSRLREAFHSALSLAVNCSYPTTEVLPILLTKARVESCALAIHSSYPTSETIPELIKKAYSEMFHLLSQLKIPEEANLKEKVEKAEAREEVGTAKKRRLKKEVPAGGET